MSAHGPLWPDEGNALDRLVDELSAQHARRSRIEWAAIMLARDVDTCESILRGRPVLVRRLDGAALRRAMRGRPLPEPDSYLRVRQGHLEAIAEGGPFA